MSAVVTEALYYKAAHPEKVYRVNLRRVNFATIKEDVPWITQEDYLPEGMPVNYALMICHKANRKGNGFQYFLEGFTRKECGC